MDLDLEKKQQSPMRWLQLPSAQKDWEAGLVADPQDWMDQDPEWWWLRHGFGRHCRRLDRTLPATRSTGAIPFVPLPPSPLFEKN